jgi:hypothetical protein
MLWMRQHQNRQQTMGRRTQKSGKSGTARLEPISPPATYDWRDIAGHEGLYSVSTLGRVRSLDRDVAMINRWGDPMLRRVPERILKPSRGIRGRLRVNLFRDGRECHRLISNRAIKQWQ